MIFQKRKCEQSLEFADCDELLSTGTQIVAPCGDQLNLAHYWPEKYLRPF